MKQFYLYKNRGGRVCIDIDPPSGQKEINFFDPPPPHRPKNKLLD